MIVTKRVLIESVLKETTIDDVLSGKHYADVEDEVSTDERVEKDIEFYRRALDTFIEWLEKRPINIKSWAMVVDNNNNLKETSVFKILPFVMQFIARQDVKGWARGIITDEKIKRDMADANYAAVPEHQKARAVLYMVYIRMAYEFSVIAPKGYSKN